MKRIIPLLLLTGCPKSGPVVEAPSNMPPAEAGPVAVMMMWGDDLAIPMACYAPNQAITRDPDACGTMIGDPAGFAGASGARGTLSGRGTWDCAGEEGTGLAMKLESTGRRDAGPEGSVVVAPAARAEAVRLWTRGGELDDDLVAAYAERADAWAKEQGDDPEYYFVPQPRLMGSLEADFDGDGRIDTIYTIHPEGETDAYEQTFAGPGPRVLFARLSRTPGLVVLHETDFEDMTAFAAFELDGVGGSEVFYDMPYYEGDSTNLGRIVDGELEWVGGWGCGL